MTRRNSGRIWASIHRRAQPGAAWLRSNYSGSTNCTRVNEAVDNEPQKQFDGRWPALTHRRLRCATAETVEDAIRACNRRLKRNLGPRGPPFQFFRIAKVWRNARQFHWQATPLPNRWLHDEMGLESIRKHSESRTPHVPLVPNLERIMSAVYEAAYVRYPR